ncbi:MAG: hypothetical protein U0802_22315 [Candidatus Binatia bacterium]
MSLLRGLDDLGLGDRRVRRVAIRGAGDRARRSRPLMVAALSMYAVGNHAEGTAIDMLLLALFAARRGRGGAAAGNWRSTSTRGRSSSSRSSPWPRRCWRAAPGDSWRRPPPVSRSASRPSCG